MTSPAEIECKKICVFRCLYSVSLSIAMQYFLLAVFLLLVNFHIFHPISWITQTFSLICSFYTWLCIMPLISAIIIYGIFLGNSYLSVARYYPTRFSWIWSTSLRKIASAVLHGTVGFLTAWLYSRFLHDDYSSMFFDRPDRPVLNSRYTFLTLNGVYAGIYYFIKEGLTKEPEIEFPAIQENTYVKIRSNVYSTLYASLMKSFTPTVWYTLLYWLLGNTINQRIASAFSSDADETLNSFFSIATSLRLLLYIWVLSSQILSNMYLINTLFAILLTQAIEFPIEKNPLQSNSSDVTLVEALALTQFPIGQQLASLDLYNLSQSKNGARRQQIFSLSIPGGHPYNWNQLSGQCLSLIRSFTDELVASVKNISTMKNTTLYTHVQTSATEAAEKILLRQYNETFGIRKMMAETCTPGGPQPTEPPADACKRANDAFNHFMKTIDDAKQTVFHAIPGLFYLFGEQDGAKTAFLLSKSRDIVWISQGLAGICASSLKEDKYGVVQAQLPNIIRALLQLKLELDKLNNVNLNGKKPDRDFYVLKNAVKRSLYRICTVFGDYMKDLMDDADELRQLQCFVNYQEV